MCERTCPACGSTEHFEGYSMAGSYLICTGDECGLILAIRADEQAARTDLTEVEIDAWVLANTGVRPGAEAKDPADDVIWTGNAVWPPICSQDGTTERPTQPREEPNPSSSEGV